MSSDFSAFHFFPNPLLRFRQSPIQSPHIFPAHGLLHKRILIHKSLPMGHQICAGITAQANPRAALESKLYCLLLPFQTRLPMGEKVGTQMVSLSAN